MLELKTLNNNGTIKITDKQLIDIAKFTGETIEKTTELLKRLATENLNKLFEMLDVKK